jgi:hypothetical protein
LIAAIITHEQMYQVVDRLERVLTKVCGQASREELPAH